jgi:hypothetical protein
MAILILAILPFVSNITGVDGFIMQGRISSPAMMSLFIMLGFIGGFSVEWPYIQLGRFIVAGYFVSFIVFIPISYSVENLTCFSTIRMSKDRYNDISLFYWVLFILLVSYMELYNHPLLHNDSRYSSNST